MLAKERVLITNVYPYIVDTDLFSGFNGLALWLIPLLKQERVAEELYQKAFVDGQEEVYIPWFAYWLGIGMLIVRPFSERLRIFINQIMMGDGMLSLKKRSEKI